MKDNNMYQLDLNDLINILCPSKEYAVPQTYQASQTYSGHFVPDVQRIHYNGNKTIVWFVDGSKVITDCSAGDKYDRQTALAYAIVKRMYGKIGAYDKNGHWDPCLVDGNGFGTKMKKLVDSGFDQVKEEQLASEKKRTARAEHEARQKAQQVAAFERRAQALAEELRLKRRAEEIFATSLENPPKKIINESKPKEFIRTSGLMQVDPKDAWKFYRRPDKPFSQFTDAEKREYWKAHNAKRRAKKA